MGIKAFISKYSRIYNADVPGCTDEYIYALHSYEWPGNVRELEHLIESSIVMLQKNRPLSLLDLPDNILRCCTHKDISLTINSRSSGYDLLESIDNTGENTNHPQNSTKYSLPSDLRDGDQIRRYLENQERELLIEIFQLERYPYSGSLRNSSQ